MVATASIPAFKSCQHTQSNHYSAAHLYSWNKLPPSIPVYNLQIQLPAFAFPSSNARTPTGRIHPILIPSTSSLTQLFEPMAESNQ